MKTHVLVKEISANKYLVGKNETSLIDPNIIYVVANGDQTDEIIASYIKAIELYSANISGKLNFLINLNNCGKNSPRARAKWLEFAEDDNTNRVAMFGMHPVAKVIASFVMKLTKKNNQRFFNSKEEALKWLKAS